MFIVTGLADVYRFKLFIQECFRLCITALKREAYHISQYQRDMEELSSCDDVTKYKRSKVFSCGISVEGRC